jgi:hypothetical protein
MVVLPFNHLYTIQEQSFGQMICDKLWCYFKNILDPHSWVPFASCRCLNRFYIPNFVHHHLWLGILQELGKILIQNVGAIH